MINKPATIQVQEQLSTASYLMKHQESISRVEELSLEEDGEENDKEINIIVEENSNDFSNRKAIEEHSPIKIGQNNREYSKFTPSKNILNSKQIVSDMKDDYQFEDEAKHMRAKMIGKNHQINSLTKNPEEFVCENPKFKGIGTEKKPIEIDLEIKDLEEIVMDEESQIQPTINNPFKNQEVIEEKKETRESPHFERSDQLKNSENCHKNTAEEIENERIRQKIMKNISSQKSSVQNKNLKVSYSFCSKEDNMKAQISQSNLSEVCLKSTKTENPQTNQSLLKTTAKPSVEKSQISSKSHHRNQKRVKTSSRMELGLFNLATYSTQRRRSKVSRRRKREIKEQQKKFEVPQNPEILKASIAENFKKMKLKNIQEGGKEFLIPQKMGFNRQMKVGMKNKRQMLLLNKENLPSY